MRGDPGVSWGDHGELICPDCGGDNLHQDEVRVYTRRGEDQNGVLVTVDEDGKTSTVAMPAESLRGRRESLLISYWCECCHEGISSAPLLWLELQQDRGCTFATWASDVEDAS